MQVIKLTDAHKVKWRFYSADVACRLISENQWGVPVEGVHQGTLTTQWRATGSQFGQRIGRDLFFTKDNLERLGYKVELDRYWINPLHITHLGASGDPPPPEIKDLAEQYDSEQAYLKGESKNG